MNRERKTDEFLTNIFLTYKGLMFSIAKKYADDLSEQEDIVQEALVNLCRKEETLKGFSEPVLICYIKRTLQNTAINHLRKRSRVQEMEQSFDNIEESSGISQGSAEELLLDRDRRDFFYAQFQKLSETDQDLLFDKYFLDLDDREIAERIHCKTSSIRMKLTRARRNFRNLIKQGGGER